MKKIIIASLVALSTLTAMAAPKKGAVTVNYKSIQSFEAEFGNVANVAWSCARNNMLRASFVQDEETVSAFFSPNGEYVGSTVTLTADDLPKKLRNNIAARYPGYNLIEAFELRTAEGVSFYTKLQKDGSSVLLKGNAGGYFTAVTEQNPY